MALSMHGEDEYTIAEFNPNIRIPEPQRARGEQRCPIQRNNLYGLPQAGHRGANTDSCGGFGSSSAMSEVSRDLYRDLQHKRGLQIPSSRNIGWGMSLR